MLLEGEGLVPDTRSRTRKHAIPALFPLSQVGAEQLGPRRNFGRQLSASYP